MNTLTKCTVLENVFKSISTQTTENLCKQLVTRGMNPLVEIRQEKFYIYDLVTNNNSYEMTPISLSGFFNISENTFIVATSIDDKCIKQIPFGDSIQLSNFLTTEKLVDFILESANTAADVFALNKNF